MFAQWVIECLSPRGSSIALIAFFPVIFISVKFVFGDTEDAQRLLKSPRLLGWLFFFCCFEIFLHLLKIPLIVKLIIIIVGVIFLPLVLADQAIHCVTLVGCL